MRWLQEGPQLQTACDPPAAMKEKMCRRDTDSAQGEFMLKDMGLSAVVWFPLPIPVPILVQVMPSDLSPSKSVSR